MKQEDLGKLSEEELTALRKKSKSTSVINAVIVGALIGVAVYATVTKGVGFFTILPLFFAYIVINDKKKVDVIDKELNSRKQPSRKSEI